MKRIGIGILILAGLLTIIHSVRVWQSDKRLEQQIAAIRDAGEPVSIAELAPDSVPPEEDAATYLRRANDGVDAIQKEITPLLTLQNWEDHLDKESLERIRAAWASYPDVLPLLEQAAECEHYCSDLDFTVDRDSFMKDLMQQANSIRGPARILRVHGLQQLAEGQPNEAIKNMVLLLRLGRHFDREPSVVCFLVAIASRSMAIDGANRVLQSAKVSEPMCEKLVAELELHDIATVFRQGLVSERAFGMDAYRDLPSRTNWFLRRRWNTDESAYLTGIARQIAAAESTYADLSSKPSVPESRSPLSDTVMAQLAMKALVAAHEAATRTTALVRCLRVLIALERRAEETEIALAELGLPDEVTVDPYNGKPLQLKKRKDGWLVYSVGRNLVDDGGRVESLDDVGLGPIEVHKE